MGEKIEKIDYVNWNRRELYEFFASISNPFYSVTYTQDVTGLYCYVKERGISFYYGLIWLVTKAVNQVEAFHYAVAEGKVVRLPERSPSFTDRKKDAEFFHIVTLPMEKTMEDFARKARMVSQAQPRFICPEKEGVDLIYLSCLPWLDLTGLTNERNMDPEDAVPRIAWGKYKKDGDRVTLGMSLEVNHRFIDGAHIGQFAQALDTLQAELADNDNKIM